MSAVDESTTFVFDSGPLSHFAEAGWLGLLEMFVGGRSSAHRTQTSENAAYSHLLRRTARSP